MRKLLGRWMQLSQPRPVLVANVDDFRKNFVRLQASVGSSASCAPYKHDIDPSSREAEEDEDRSLPSLDVVRSDVVDARFDYTWKTFLALMAYRLFLGMFESRVQRHEEKDTTALNNHITTAAGATH